MVENIYSMLMVIKMNKLSEDKEFSLFIMEDVFDLFSGALVPKDELKEGNIPRVTATANQNGIAIFTDDVEHKNFRVFENFISISFLGDVFYHKTKTSLDMKIHGIKPKKMKLNMYIAQYLIPLLRNFSSKFSYGNQLSMRLLKRQRIMLPVNNKNQVDWEFMENEGYKLLNSQSLKLKEYINKRYNQLALEGTKHSQLLLENIKWRSFEIRQIASIFSGKDIYEAERTEGDLVENKYMELNSHSSISISKYEKELERYNKIIDDKKDKDKISKLLKLINNMYFNTHNFGCFFMERNEIMKRGYARVSTSGQDLQSQINILKEEKCDVIYAEKFTSTLR